MVVTDMGMIAFLVPLGHLRQGLLVGKGGLPIPPRRLERLRESCFQEFTQLGRGFELRDGIQFLEC